MLYQERSFGAHITLEQLASYKLAARLLSLRNNKRAINQISGPFTSRMRGRGMEFEEVRQYQAGDDIRNIDWRVTARTGKAYTKLFREEREKPVLIIIDQRQNMFFGSQCAMKSVLACDIAAYITWAAYQKGDKVGGLIFNDQQHDIIKPRHQQKTVLQFLHHLVNYNQALNCKNLTQKRPLTHLLKEVRAIAKPGSQLFFISDFYDLHNNDKAILHDIARHCNIAALQTYDILEQQLPKTGLYQASNGTTKVVIDANNNSYQQKYQSHFAQRQQTIQSLFSSLNIPLIPIMTNDAPLGILQHYFGGK